MVRLLSHGISAPWSTESVLNRFWAMDPQLMWTFQLTPPKDDGSSSKDMASSLRTALALDFDQAVGVHFRTMKADEFRRAVNLNWNWLDGESLLPPKNE